MLLRILTLVAVLQFALGDVNVKTAASQRDTVTIDGRNYFFSNLRLSLANARDVCANHNMTLSALENQSEASAVFAFIRDVLQAPLDFYWTSGMHLLDDWLWSSSGEFFSHADWCPGCPRETSSSAEACVQLHDSMLFDFPCYQKELFLCEQVDC